MAAAAYDNTEPMLADASSLIEGIKEALKDKTVTQRNLNCALLNVKKLWCMINMQKGSQKLSLKLTVVILGFADGILLRGDLTEHSFRSLIAAARDDKDKRLRKQMLFAGK